MRGWLAGAARKEEDAAEVGQPAKRSGKRADAKKGREQRGDELICGKKVRGIRKGDGGQRDEVESAVRFFLHLL
jgi:hypothetical protein